MSYREDESAKLRDILVRELSKASSPEDVLAAELSITRHFDLGNLLETDYTYVLGVEKGMSIQSYGGSNDRHHKVR